MILAAAIIACQFLFASANLRALAPAGLQTEPCILVRVVERELSGGSSSEGKWQCELSSADAAQTGNYFVDIEGLTDEDLKDVPSGARSLLVEGGTVSNGKLNVPAGAKRSIEKTPKRGPAEEKKRNKGKVGQRMLAAGVPDERLVMAVRVVAADSKTTSNVTDIRNFVFGTGGDPVTLKERFNSCSYGEVLMKPYNGTTSTGIVVWRGVYQVSITSKVVGVLAATVQNAVVARLTALLGDLPSQFDHVMLCLPAGVDFGTAGAYATLGGWVSVYDNGYCNDVAYQFHEVGHNLGLEHSGEGTDAYGDLTCTMGDGREKTCYNAAKNAQLNWYSDRKISLNFASRGGFNGAVIGVDSYRHSQSAGKYVYIKVEGAPFSKPDVFVGFNLAKGIHVNTGEAKNLVTVNTQQGTKISKLVAKLAAGKNYTIPNYAGTKALIIRVKTIVIPTTSDIPVANVEVYLAGCPPGTCGAACNTCCTATDCSGKGPACSKSASCQLGVCTFDTSTCSGVFTMDLTTDGYPEEVSWDVVDKCSGKTVATGGPYTGQGAPVSLVTTATIGQSSFVLTMRDSYGDGMADGTLTGQFIVTYNDAPTLNVGGGAYTSSYTAQFGDTACK